ncbi:MAG: hypothetical protein ACI9VS_003562 [Candidatus Binatia bacterium]
MFSSPHHLACGSALGGSSGLSGRGRIVNGDPLLFDGNQSLLLVKVKGSVPENRKTEFTVFGFRYFLRPFFAPFSRPSGTNPNSPFLALKRRAILSVPSGIATRRPRMGHGKGVAPLRIFAFQDWRTREVPKMPRAGARFGNMPGFPTVYFSCRSDKISTGGNGAFRSLFTLFSPVQMP